jgi:hypothetical protein
MTLREVRNEIAARKMQNVLHDNEINSKLLGEGRISEETYAECREYNDKLLEELERDNPGLWERVKENKDT